MIVRRETFGDELGSGCMRLILCLTLSVIVLAVDQCRADDTFSPEQIEFFESQVRPLLVEHCHQCHGADKQKGGLRLDSREGVLLGGESGPAVTPGQPDTSLLLTAVKYTGDTQMPPDGKLSEAQIAVLQKWISMGAVFPATVSIPDAEKLARQKSHWAFQPVQVVEPPAVHEAGWVRTPVDQFVLSHLESRQLLVAQVSEPVAVCLPQAWHFTRGSNS